MTEDRQTINATAAVMHSFDELWPETPQAMIAMLQKALALVPEEYRDAAKLETDSDYESNHIEMSIGYLRPENDEEFARRISQVKAAEDYTKRRELARLRELRAKYGDDA